LLDCGAIQFHKLKLELGTVDPRKILEGVAENQKLALQARNLTLRTQSVGDTLIADKRENPCNAG
jgi:hypothetical protein